MSVLIQLKRSTSPGITPNTTNSANATYIEAGELAINLPDGLLFSSNGTSLIEIGSRLNSMTSNSYARAKELIALGGATEGGQIILGYGNNLANNLTGQANNTFNIDVVGGNTGSTPMLRIFGQHNDQTTFPILAAANTGRIHIGSLDENTDSTLKVTGTVNVTSDSTVGGSFRAGSNIVFANSSIIKINSNDVLKFNDNTTQNTAFRVYDSTGTRIA